MIRQERLRGFLVGALLISVTSAQDFEIRSDDEPPWYLSAGMILVYIVLVIVFAFESVKFAMSVSQTNAMPISSPAIGQQIRATPRTLPTTPAPTPMQLKEQALARRPQVLAVLFPDEGKVSVCVALVFSWWRLLPFQGRCVHLASDAYPLFDTQHEGDEEEHISGRNLKYDAQSQRYIFGEDQTEATSCSICMETLGKQVEQLHNIALKPLLSTILNRVPIILQHPRMTL